LAQSNDRNDNGNDGKITKGCSEGNDNIVSRSKPYQGNNGFGNGGNDGTPGKSGITLAGQGSASR
jgi:hypothetical protein